MLNLCSEDEVRGEEAKGFGSGNSLRVEPASKRTYSNAEACSSCEPEFTCGEVVSSRYPTFRTVSIRVPSEPSFFLRLLMCTSTVRVSILSYSPYSQTRSNRNALVRVLSLASNRALSSSNSFAVREIGWLATNTE